VKREARAGKQRAPYASVSRDDLLEEANGRLETLEAMRDRAHGNPRTTQRGRCHRSAATFAPFPRNRARLEIRRRSNSRASAMPLGRDAGGTCRVMPNALFCRCATTENND
jgi:hypothetical protein